MDQHFKLKFSIFFEFILKNYFKKIVRIGNNPAFEKKIENVRFSE